MSESSKVVVLAGATGDLGSLIAQSLLDKAGVRLRLLVRPESVGKTQALQDRGAEIVEVDLADPGQAERLGAAMKGAFSVVSAVQGGPDMIVDAQLRMLEAARAAGVKRFIPSNFSYDIFGLDEGDNINSDARRAFARKAEGARGDVEVVQIQIGAFLDRKVLFGFLGAFDLGESRAFLWGDGDAVMDFTTYADAARFTAEAAVDDAPVPSVFEVAGDSLTFHDLVKAYEDASGKAITVVKLGSLSDLDAEIDKRRRAEPGNMVAWLPLMYWRAMLSGKGKLRSIANDRYPHVEPMTVADYVRSEGL
ncbi:NmrA family NAD(P)-binding protein [Jiella avicenniae]|uniref:NmrA family NAD(P)-binding protein n=1 Tax=Jiella avicenniae TaxID=2907202 RepID=A0A9X1P0Q4_9HYPH|nr:NmrA family NAD(P)-binding protein [Jiella avicenniae]MCE7029212.1 NmrA family NAD(P)-binding protein [Jiella avicenniae]